MGKKRAREREIEKGKKTTTSARQRDGAALNITNLTRKRMRLRMDKDSPIKSKRGHEAELEVGGPLELLAGASSNQGHPCCDLELRQILKSRNLIIKYRKWPSNSILGRYDEHFQVYPWYRGIALFRGCIEVGNFAFTISEAYCDKNIMEAAHVINGKEVKIKRTIMVTGIPETVHEGEFKEFFSQFGNVIEHEVVLDPETRPKLINWAKDYTTAYGFIIFDSDEPAALLAAKRSVSFAGVSVSIKTSIYEDTDSRGWFI